MTLDPATHAIRPDLADVRLAAMVFAPHYAAPVAGSIVRDVPFRPDRGGAATATLDAGEPFEVLDLVGGDAWGIASARGAVGWIAGDAVRCPA